MKDLVNENIRSIIPYKVHDLDYDIKLDANENPYSIPEYLPKEVQQDLKDSIFNELWNYYPDADAKKLKKILAENLGVLSSNLLIGNGSDEILLNLMLTYVNSNKKILIHPPTFSMYKILCQISNGTTIEVPLKENFELDKEEMLKYAKQDDVALTFITYPNNPTGQLFNKKDIIEIIENAKGLVIIDEAYYEFAKDSFVDLVKNYKNLIVLRTFSKAYGIAGLRVGYMIANEERVEEVNKVRLPYNINKLSQVIAIKMLENKKHFDQIIDVLLKERDILLKELKNIEELKVFKSDTNSVFFKTEKAYDLFDKLLENKIFVRKFSGELKNYLRISVAREVENKKIIKIIKEFFNKIDLIK